MIQLYHVTKYYGKERPALIDISFKVEKGEFIFITGPSGAGKTTLLRLLFCEERPDEGQILIQGVNVVKIKSRAVPYFRRHIGFVFQDFRLLPKKTVFDNIALTLKIVGVAKSNIKKMVFESLRMVGLEHKKDAYPVFLSGGEKQRVAIARAIVNSPPIILADEPTGNLDSGLSKEIFGILKEINHRGTTIIITTHDRRIVDEEKRRSITLQKGAIVNEKAMIQCEGIPSSAR
ncbi:MAG: cell division ATP-binding protein FtsE [Nitrospirota bacterium]